MAFDSVFQGPPSDVAAPGTKQSPSLGVDVTNKELYVSSGDGWEELSSGGGSGNLSGTLTPGIYPIASAPTVLSDGTVDYSVSSPDTLTLTVPSGSNIFLGDNNSNTGMGLGPFGSTSLLSFQNFDSGGIFFTDLGGGGIEIDSEGPGQLLITAGGIGGIQIVDLGGGGITVTGIVSPGVLYSAAGTPLPDATTVPQGAEATVSDATTPTYMGAYVSGGAIICKVISNGTGWFTH